MTDSLDRRDELVAAAVTGDLTAADRVELDALRASDPSIDAEIDDLRDAVARLRTVVTWDEPVAGDLLRARVQSIPDRDADAGAGRADAGDRARGTSRTDAGSRTHGDVRRRRWVGVLLGTAAACLALGVLAGVAVPPLLNAPPSGPPGTLGAVEQVAFEAPAGLDIDAQVVAHTWGTETRLDIAGLEPSATYAVVLVGRGGDEYPSGELIGTANTVTCRLNAAVLREDSARIELRDAEGGVLATAELPAAEA